VVDLDKCQLLAPLYGAGECTHTVVITVAVPAVTVLVVVVEVNVTVEVLRELSAGIRRE
jgi:hypothetical protein